MSYLTASFDDPSHRRARLGILAILVEASSAQLRFLRETLQLTDGNLSRYLRLLEAASLVKIAEGHSGKRQRTAVLITRSGRRAFAAEIAELRARVDRFGDAPG